MRSHNVIELSGDAGEGQLLKTPEMPTQEIRSFVTKDGVNIAYSRCGDGPPLVKTANWLNHLEFEWQSPIRTHWVTELIRHRTLFRYDERGNGLPDWNIQDFSFQAWVRDFEQLIETIQLDRFAAGNLTGWSRCGVLRCTASRPGRQACPLWRILGCCPICRKKSRHC